MYNISLMYSEYYIKAKDGSSYGYHNGNGRGDGFAISFQTGNGKGTGECCGRGLGFDGDLEGNGKGNGLKTFVCL